MDTIQVAIRVRPIIEREKNSLYSIYWKVKDNFIYQIDEDGSPSNEPFVFDKIFDESVDNHHIYNDSVHGLVTSALEGFNSTVFAYGQTSTGKSFTMTGSTKTLGIMQLAVNRIFDIIENCTDRKYLIRVSYIEIYNEKVNDLLCPGNVDLKVREDKDGNHFVSAKEEVTSNPDQVFNLLRLGNKTRKIAATDMNERSSRSHTILKIIVESTPTDGQQSVQISHLHFVDLAGSERTSQTKAAGHRLKEGVHINLSLSTLCNVIRQLSENERFVNFRDSKLTRLLQHALGGNAKTLIIANVTPAACDDTNSTLLFAKNAKKIKNKPIINQVVSDQDKAKRYEALSTQYKMELEKELQNKAELRDQMKNRELLISELEQKLQAIDFFNSSKLHDTTQLRKRRHTTIGYGQEQAIFSLEDSRKPSLCSIPEDEVFETPAFSRAIPTPAFSRALPTPYFDREILALKNKEIEDKDKELAALKNKLMTEEDKTLTSSVQAYMETEIENLKQALNAAYRELDDKEWELKTTKSRTASLEESFRNLEEFTKLEKVCREEDTLKAELESLKSKNTEYESLIKSHEQQFATLKAANNDFKSKVITLEADLKKTTKEYERVKMINMQLAVDYEVQMDQLKLGFKQREAMYVNLLKQWEEKPVESQEHAVMELIGKLNKSEEERRLQHAEIQQLKDMIINKDLELAEKDAIIIEYDEKFVEQSMEKGEDFDFEDLQGRLHMIKDILLGEQEVTSTFVETVQDSSELVKQLKAEKEEIEGKLIELEIRGILNELSVNVELNDAKQRLELLRSQNLELERNARNKIEQNKFNEEEYQSLVQELKEEKVKLELVKKEMKIMSVQLKQQSDLTEQFNILRQELDETREINAKYANDLKEELVKQQEFKAIENERILQLDAAEKDLQRKDVQIDMLQKAIIQLETDMEELKIRLKDEEAKDVELQGRIDKMEEDMRELEEEKERDFKSYEESVVDMRVKLEVLEKTNKSLQQNLDELEADKDGLQTRVGEDMEKLKEEIKELKKANEDLEQCLRNLGEEKERDLQSFEELKVKLEKTNENLQQTLDESQHNQSKLIEVCRKMIANSDKIMSNFEETVNRKLNALTQKIVSCEEHVTKLPNFVAIRQFEDLKRELSVSNHLTEKIKTEIHEQRNETKSLAKKLTKAYDELSERELKIKELEAEKHMGFGNSNDELRNKHKKLEDKVQFYKEKYENLMEDMQQKNIQITDLMAKVCTLEDSKSRTSSPQNVSPQELRKLRRQSLQDRSRSVSLTLECETCTEQTKKLKTLETLMLENRVDILKLKDTVKEKDLEIEKLSNLKESLETMLAKKDAEVKTLRTETQNRKTTTETLRKIKRQSLQDQNRSFDTCETCEQSQKTAAEIDKLQRENERLKARGEELEGYLDEENELIQTLERKLNLLNSDSNSQKIVDLDEQVQTLNNELRTVKKNYKEAISNLKDKEDDLVDLQADYDRLECEKKIVEASELQLTKKLEDLNTQYNKLQTKLSFTVAHSQREIDSLKKQIEDLKTKLTSLRVKQDTDCCDTCKFFATKIGEQDIALKEYECRIKNLNFSVKDFKEKYDKLKSELETKPAVDQSEEFSKLQSEAKRYETKYHQACKVLRMRRTEILQLRELLGLGEDDEIPGTSK